MITINDILPMVAEHERLTGETMTELSRRATGKKDTIRNWKRRLETGEEPGASFQNVQSILLAMGVEVKLGDSSSPIRSDEEIINVLQRIDGLDKRGVEIAFSVISSHLLAIGRVPKPSPADADGQSSSPSSRREASSSR